MCLYVLKGYKTPRKATEDIVVYKRLHKTAWPNEFKSPYQGATYNRGKTYTSIVDYTSSTYRKYPRVVSGETVIGEIHMGIHAYTTKQEVYSHRGSYEAVIKCIIPKGAKYHLGSNNEIVTNKLIIPEIKRKCQ